ncbi:hypothetical protein, partial [Microvirga massiliensis]|uniref:hypothetical protein n=1 Tax=Microvirga massiliensis TaxID=1033741 RepID=UPI000AA92F8F
NWRQPGNQKSLLGLKFPSDRLLENQQLSYSGTGGFRLPFPLIFAGNVPVEGSRSKKPPHRLDPGTAE